MKNTIKKIIMKFTMIINSVRLRLGIIYNDKYFKGVPFMQKIILNIQGFQSDKWILYNLKNNNKKKYLSDFQRWNSTRINGPYNITMDDKMLSFEVFNKYIPFPINIGYIREEKIISYDTSEVMEVSDLLDALDKYEKILLKPIGGAKGAGVYVISVIENIYYLNDQPVSLSKMENTIYSLDGYLLTEYIIQHDYSRKLYKDTTNTLRILTMRNHEDNTIFIPAALHRIGNVKSFPVDNWSQGGYSTLVSVDTGVIESQAASFTVEEGLGFVDKHPENNQSFKGVQVPHWNNIKKSIISCHERFPTIHFIAWDIVVTKNSFRVIELNNSTDFDVFEVHKPLLSDKRIYDYYKFHGIV